MPPPPPALAAAVTAGNATEVEAMLKADPSVASSSTAEEGTLLHAAAEAGHEQVCENEHTSQLLFFCAEREARRSRDADTPVHARVLLSRHQIIKLLLTAGTSAAALDEDGQTALHKAAGEGHAGALKLLAPTCACAELFVCDKYEMTPFHLACENGHDGCAAHILALCEQLKDEPGTRKAEQMRRGSALFLAQKGGHENIVNLITTKLGAADLNGGGVAGGGDGASGASGASGESGASSGDTSGGDASGGGGDKPST